MKRRAWALHRAYPPGLRRSWSIEQLRAAHSRYVRGRHDSLTTAMESEYARRRRTGFCQICGRRGRVAKTVCAYCRDAFAGSIAALADLPARSA